MMDNGTGTSTPTFLQGNPFTVLYPEEMEPSWVLDIFVDVFSDFEKVRHPGHTILNGPRGCGKSMIFRYLCADCQRLVRGSELKDLPFYALYVGIKQTELSQAELRRIVSSLADYGLVEHYLIAHILYHVATTISADLQGSRNDPSPEVTEYFESVVVRRLKLLGMREEMLPQFDAAKRPSDNFKALALFAEELKVAVMRLFQNFARMANDVNVDGPYLTYLEFLLPMLRGLKEIPALPVGPVFLLIDDADSLLPAQVQVINGWIYTRTAQSVSIKLSTQYGYPTYRTASGRVIEEPHDFQFIDVTSIYTNRRSKFRKRVDAIIRRRLTLFGIPVSPTEFFPPDEEQETAIAKIEEEFREKWATEGRGYRPIDDSLRYGRPEFIRRLKEGQSKSGPSYSYAGFDQLVNISSGVLRHFLHPAMLMYDLQAEQDAGEVRSISPSIQDDVVRKLAKKLMFDDFATLSADKDTHEEGVLSRAAKLQNLLMALGGLFHQILISGRSERKVFSIALSQRPDREIEEVLALGVAHGYLIESSIGNKEGNGRTRLYVLSRRLSPFFLLDPFGFAGYLFVTNDLLRDAMRNPRAALRRLKSNSDDVGVVEQASLFEGEDE